MEMQEETATSWILSQGPLDGPFYEPIIFGRFFSCTSINFCTHEISHFIIFKLYNPYIIFFIFQNVESWN